MNKFLKLDTWRQIIESRRVYNQNKNTEWYKDRSTICNSCPFNSKNKKLKTFKEKFFSLLSFKNPYCTACKCTLKYKLALEESVCGLEEIGEEPKWESQWK